jgi:hypothetical protein
MRREYERKMKPVGVEARESALPEPKCSSSCTLSTPDNPPKQDVG